VKAAATERSEGGLASNSASSYGSASQPKQMQFFYVYILQSESFLDRFYTGSTGDLRARLDKHNAGEVTHTAKYRPWRIKTAIAFTHRERASQFELYLKTASGRAFIKKHL